MLPKKTPARFGACALAIAISACTSSTPPPTADAGAITGTCSSDAECMAGFKCDRPTRQCYCTSDAACGSGLFCNAFTGLCVTSIPGCTSNAACSTGQYCDAALRSCEAITPACGKCRTDAECGSNSFCAANPHFPNAGTFCSPSCVAAAPDAGGNCPGGLVCEARTDVATGQTLCYPASGACGVTNACIPDSLAICAKDADCNDTTQVCDTTAKDCVAKNRVCPAGDSCDPQERVCGHDCSTDADCKQIEGAAGFQCRNNACYALATCNSDADCGTGLDCLVNTDGSKSCKPGCVHATDCPIGQGCNSDPMHPKCTAGCQSNTDCPLNQICNSAACVSAVSGCAQVCQTTSVCAIGGSCSSNDCCVGANFSQLCANNKCTANTANGCLPLYGHSCANQNDCSDLPNTTCVPVEGSTYCGGTLQLQPCTDNSQCPYKGFSCTSFGGATKFCTPVDAAISACYNGHT